MGKMSRFFFVSLCIVIQSTAVFACSCDGEPDLKSSLASSQMVFSGTVISKTTAVNLTPYGIETIGEANPKNKFEVSWLQSPIAVYTLKIDKIYKGKTTSETITILTPINGSACGFRFEIGRKYTVFATTNENALTQIERKSIKDSVYFTNNCSLTGEWSKSDEKDIEAFMR